MAHNQPQSTFPVSASEPSRLQESIRVTWISVGVNVLLVVVQFTVGIMANAQSLIADAMHTFSDIIGDGFVLYASHHSARDADESHPYGHGRFETVASLVLGLLLVATGASILASAATRLQNIGQLPPIGIAAVLAATITLIGKESLFRYMLKIAERLRSPMLVANAWHARADALSSLVVAIGIGAALAGYIFADAAAAIIVAGMIIKAGIKFSWDALRELIDTALPSDEVAAMLSTVQTTPGVVNAHEIRTRRMGHKVLADVHLQVNPKISVSEGHLIAERARARVLKSHPDVLDVLVHVDAEDDEDPSTIFFRAPDRQIVLARLQQIFGDALPATYLEKTLLHYVGRRVEAEVFLPSHFIADPTALDALKTATTNALKNDELIAEVQIHCSTAHQHP